MQKKMIIFTADKYPDGDAGSVRTHTLTKLASMQGFAPVVIGMGESTNGQYRTADGITYCSLRFNSRCLVARTAGRLLYPERAAKRLKTVNPAEIAAVMYVGGGKRLLDTLKKYAARYDIPLLHDSVEWYSPSEFKKGTRDPFYLRNQALNERWIDSAVRVIAISSYLEKYFAAKKIPVVRIPAIMDVLEMPYQCDAPDGRKIKLIYAGSPGSKDRLCELVDALAMLSEDRRSRIDLRIIGMNEETYREAYDAVSLDQVGDCVRFEGRKSRAETLRAVRESDFAFLLRPSEERYAKAGFPTKVVESLSSGTAMLCNLTSDLGMYLKDGENSVLIRDCSAEACADALNRLLSYSPLQIAQMKAEARKTAEKYFDWRLYAAEWERLFAASEG